jgi:hypothetical protein
VDALADHDCDLTAHTMATHILSGKARLLERVKGQGVEVLEPCLRITKENE